MERSPFSRKIGRLLKKMDRNCICMAKPKTLVSAVSCIPVGNPGDYIGEFEGLGSHSQIWKKGSF